MLLGLLALSGATLAWAGVETWVHTTPQAGDFPLVAEGESATVLVAPGDAKVVSLAAADLVRDVESVTGRQLRSAVSQPGDRGPLILIGTLGQSPAIDALVAEGAVTVGDLRHAWESFVITTTTVTKPNARPALVIVGSDRRGTAYGVYELSQAIGVSPWYWWADVTPEKHPALYVAAGTRRFGPPSVKYRGIFLNDEDWGLQPWAAKTFEPENGGIGPKTYAKLFELMLRLKANTVWPAMHACTKPFNAFPENARLADDYAIVMGSSHAEPMLRDNVGEWKDAPERYNYVTNRDGVRAYWEERTRTNGRFENIYTLGMRGVHDSGIQGAKTDAERIQVLTQVFADQRAMLQEGATFGVPAGAKPNLAQVPQMFCAYKEVLGLYRQGLKVPDDVTIVWPDDNFGYVRNFANAEERQRSGGFGVYYHLSYLGAPMAYLWLSTTPPALVWEEMTKAYAYGAKTIWIANVGDLKPAEIGTEFFLSLAWNVETMGPNAQPEFLRHWAAREFGAANAAEIAAIMGEYYRLNDQRRPEHLQWWLPKERPRPSPFTRTEVDSRLADFGELVRRVETIEAALPVGNRDSFFELVAYPVRGAALANLRYFQGERAGLAVTSAERTAALALATSANTALDELTQRYNEQIAGGKWRGLMNLEPADNQWRSFRISKWEAPAFSAAAAPEQGATVLLSAEAGHFSTSRAGAQGHWTTVPGLGRTGRAVTLLPAAMPAAVTSAAPCLEYAVTFPAAGNYDVTLYLVPTFPVHPDRGVRIAVGMGDEPPKDLVLPIHDGAADWAQGVLDGTRTVSTSVSVPAAGTHSLRVYGVEPGVVLDKIVVSTGHLPPSYIGPVGTRRP